MANLVIISSGNRVDVVLNDYGSSIGLKKESYRLDDIVEVSLDYNDGFVEVIMRDSHEKRTWYVTYDSAYTGDEYFIVDSVNAAAPTSQDDLYNKIKELM